jgi:hypothetical protein
MTDYSTENDEVCELVRPPNASKRFKTRHDPSPPVFIKPDISKNSPIFWALQTDG